MKKRQKSKMTMLIVGGLAAVSLVSVGFASWVISGTESTSSAVNVTVGTVNNDSLTATVLDSGKNLDLCFDNVESPSGGILTTATQDKYEDLSFIIPVKISGNLTKLNTIDFTFTGTLVDAALYGTGETEYLIAPWVTIDGAKKVVYTYNNGGTGSLNPVDGRVTASDKALATEENVDTVTVTFTFKFQWGAAFNKKNPGNVKESEITKSKLIARLNAFDTAMPDSPTLSVAIAPTLKPSN